MPARFALRVFSFEVPMPVPSTINDLSTTAGSNSPGGGENPFPDLDNYLRAHASFIAALRDGKLDASAVSAFMLTVLNDADAATARATLGIKTWDTGEWVLTAKTTAPAGTVTPNGGTIGSASSGATTRANADTSDLFALLWSATNNTDYPIQDSSGVATTRGASASADFSANKRLPLPNIQDGDALIAAVSSAVLTRSAGDVLSHTHTITVDSGGTHSHTLFTGVTGAGDYPVGGPGPVSSTANPIQNGGAHTHNASASDTGGTKNKAAGLMIKVYIAL